MPILVICVVGLIAILGFSSYEQKEFRKEMIQFESRCTGKGGLTLQAYKTGTSWVGCYKNGVELENEQ